MEILTAQDAVEAYKSFDDWQYADREAAWKWMFEEGRKAEREACAKICDDEICACCWEEDAQAAAEHIATTIRNRGA